MRKLLLVIPDDDRPKVQRIAEAIRDAIQQDRLKPTEKIPSSRELAQELGVHRQTVMQALEDLVDEGWIRSEPRKGYRVTAYLPDAFYVKDHSVIKPPQKQGLIARTLGLPMPVPVQEPQEPVRWNFRSGRSDLRLFPLDELRTSLSESLRRRKEKILDYGHPEGYPALVDELTTYLRLVRSIKDREILVTNGCQEAIYLSMRLLIKPGEAVAVESLSYPFALETLLRVGAVLHPVPIDAEGMQAEGLEELCRRMPIKMVFLTPTHHFPTTATMSLPRREAIYAVAARYGVIILEDDFDHEYHYVSSPLPPIAAHDTEGLVIYASSLSKIMFPSARIGFLALPPGTLKGFLQEKVLLSLQNSLLIQDAIAHWMRSGGAVAHLNKTRRVYQKRMENLLQLLQQHKQEGLDLDWQAPDGGMAVWVRTPWNSTLLYELAQQQGILFQHEAECRIDGRDGPHIRIGFARHTEKEMAEGLKVLLDLGRGLPPP